MNDASHHDRSDDGDLELKPHGVAGDDAPLGAHGDIVDELTEGVQVIGFDYSYVYVNEAVARQARRTKRALLGRPMAECFPDIDATPMFATLRRAMEERLRFVIEDEFAFPDGTSRWFELRFLPVPMGVCILSLDVDERKRSQFELARVEEHRRQAQKMEAIGRLAGGVAHDFNNLLSVILSYTELILGDERLHAGLRDDLDEVRAAGIRAADLTRQLLAFSRQQVLHPRVLDINEIVGGMHRMLARLLGADVELTTVPGEGLWSVRADPGSIEQVLMNLAINARDAMVDGGKLTIETANVELDEAYGAAHAGVTAGEHVMIAVSDTGVGMDDETQARIFEPFFTTKEKGKGTGLGLATVFGIVKQSGGHIWVYSEPGGGTTFKVYLPRAIADAERVSIPRVVAEVHRGTETILLVEDDEHVRALAAGVLRRNGYLVIEARDGHEAIAAAKQLATSIDLIVCDVVLPRMSGRELAERLATHCPGTKTLFVSGYADEAILRHGILDRGVAYLQKPLTPSSLSRAVRQVLGAPSSEAERRSIASGDDATGIRSEHAAGKRP